VIKKCLKRTGNSVLLPGRETESMPKPARRLSDADVFEKP